MPARPLRRAGLVTERPALSAGGHLQSTGAGCAGIACAVSGNLTFKGGGVVDSTPAVYLLFAGSGWGSYSTTADGYVTFSNDPSGEAVILQQMFAGLGTDTEAWSRGIGEYCDNLAKGSTSCTNGSPHFIPTPPASGNAIQVAYLDDAGSNSLSHTDLTLAVAAAASQWNLSSANTNAQIVVASPHGGNPDGFQTGHYCAWHDMSTVAYTNFPYVTDKTGCNDGNTRGITQVASHEYVETLTDPATFSGWTAAAGTVQYGDGSTNSSDDSEIGDLCQNHDSVAVPLATGTFRLTTYWSNAFQQCVGLPAKVLVVGDSITNGMIGDYTWRYRLMQNFQATGTPVRFVGHRTGTYDMYIDPGYAAQLAGQPIPDRNNLNPDPTDGAYRVPFPNSNHESVWGWTMASASAISSPVYTDATNDQPDDLVIALGFNDLAFGTSVTDTQANLSSIIAAVRRGNPNVHVVVTTVIQRTPLAGWPNINAGSSQYNAALPSYTASISTPTSPVTVADVAAAYNASTMSWDGLHPNSIGEFVIAKAVSNALQLTGLGSGWNLPIPSTVDSIALATPTLTLTNTPSGVKLSWNHIYGADGYYIYTVDGAGTQTKLPLAIPWDSYVDHNVYTGKTYAYRITAARGSVESAQASQVQITASVSTRPPPTFTVTPATTGTTVSWTAVSGATSYQVVSYDTATGMLNTGTTTTPKYVIPASQLVKGDPYAVGVSSVNQYGAGPQAAGSGFIALYGTPAAPVLHATYLNSTSDTLTWTEASPSAGFWVYTRASATATTWTQLPYELAGTSRSWVAGVYGAQHKVVQFCLKAANGDSRSACSNIVTAP